MIDGKKKKKNDIMMTMGANFNLFNVTLLSCSEMHGDMVNYLHDNELLFQTEKIYGNFKDPSCIIQRSLLTGF